MTYSDINTLESPLFCSPLNKPIIAYSTYIRNKHKSLDYDYWKVHLFDGCVEFDPRYLHGIFNSYKNNAIPSSATLSKITDITNKYFADKIIYIPGSLPQLSYYIAPRANGKSLRTLCYFAKLMDSLSHAPIIKYSFEYTMQDYKYDMENLYKRIIYKKLISLFSTNDSHKQRSNNQEEMSCLKIISEKNNTTRKFHK